MGISQNALARVIDVPPRRVNEIALGKRSITADTALRLARAFGTSEQFWMGLQVDYDLEEATQCGGRGSYSADSVTCQVIAHHCLAPSAQTA